MLTPLLHTHHGARTYMPIKNNLSCFKGSCSTELCGEGVCNAHGPFSVFFSLVCLVYFCFYYFLFVYTLFNFFIFVHFHFLFLFALENRNLLGDCNNHALLILDYLFTQCSKSNVSQPFLVAYYFFTSESLYGLKVQQ